MNSSIVQIAHYDSIIPSSPFAPKEKVVKILPSIDECLSLLPRSVGNHILSYTTAWYDFYLENLIKKYGYKFVITTLARIFRFHIKTTAKYNIEFFKQINKLSKERRSINRTLILKTFNLAIIQREQAYQEWKSLQVARRLDTKQRQQIWFNKIEVGDIITNGANTSSYIEYYLILEKTKTTYYSIEIKIQYFPSAPPPPPTAEEQIALTQEELAFKIWCNLNPSTEEEETKEETKVDTNTYLISLNNTAQFSLSINRNMLFDYPNPYGVRQLERKPVRVVYTKFKQGKANSYIQLMTQFQTKEDFMIFNGYKQIGKSLNYHSV